MLTNVARESFSENVRLKKFVKNLELNTSQSSDCVDAD